jgi:hypothetical protein
MNQPNHESIAAMAASDHHGLLEREAVKLELLAEREAEALAELERAITARLVQRRSAGNVAASTEVASADADTGTAGE